MLKHRKEHLVSTVRTQCTKFYGKSSVNIIHERAESHGTEAVYENSKWKNRKATFSLSFSVTEIVSKQSRVVREPVMLCQLVSLQETSFQIVAAGCFVCIVCSIFTHGSCLLGCSGANGMEDSN